MRIRIIVAGKPALSFAKAGTADYFERLAHYGRYEMVHVRAGDAESVSQELLGRSAGNYRIAMDERGQVLTTAVWAKKFEMLEMQGHIKSVAFLIGASDGHTADLRTRVDAVWSLSALTLQHELALVVLLEQIYRVATIRRGEPYHR